MSDEHTVDLLNVYCDMNDRMRQVHDHVKELFPDEKDEIIILTQTAFWAGVEAIVLDTDDDFKNALARIVKGRHDPPLHK